MCTLLETFIYSFTLSCTRDLGKLYNAFDHKRAQVYNTFLFGNFALIRYGGTNLTLTEDLRARSISKQAIKQTSLRSEIYWLLLPGHSAALHLIRQLDIFAVNVVLPLSLPENPGKYRTRVNAHPHVDRAVRRLLYILDRVHH